jgi:hypothetical protein
VIRVAALVLCAGATDVLGPVEPAVVVATDIGEAPGSDQARESGVALTSPPASTPQR